MSSSTQRLQPGEIEIIFTHPSGPGKKPCAVNESTTGDQAIEGLIVGRFLEPETNESRYSLALDRGNGKSSQLNRATTFVTQGIKSGDTVKVVSINAGA